MNERINLLLNEYLKENQYKEYNNVLKKEITIFFVKLIQKKNKNYLYGTFVELAEDVERYLEDKEVRLFNKYYGTLKLDIEDKELSERLLEIYDKLV